MTLTPLWLTLIITALTTLLLISGKVRADIVGLLVVVALAISGVVPLQTALSGFSSNVVFVLIAIFILTKGLETTGVTAILGERLARLGNGGEWRLVIVTMLAAAVLSLFMNTVAAAAVLLPPVLAITRQRAIAPSRVLIPLAYGTLLGGTATLLTTANLVTSASLAAHGLQPYGLFDFLPVGLPVTIAGLLYMGLFGRHLLPRRGLPRPQPTFSDLTATYHLDEGLHPLEVLPGSRLVGRPARKPGLAKETGLTLVGIFTPRGLRFAHQIVPERKLLPGDVILVSGDVTRANLEAWRLKVLETPDVCEAFRAQATLAELALNPRGEAPGHTIGELRMYVHYGLRVLAIWRQGNVLDSHLQAIPLQAGDTLLVQIPPQGLRDLRADPNFVVLQTIGEQRGHQAPWRQALAVGLLLLALVPAALGWAPLALSTLGSATLMMLFGIVPPDQAYQAISWRAIFLIAGMIPLGVAMRDTGAAAFLSAHMLKPLEHAPAWVIATAFLLLTTLLAQVTSGQVAALILAPLAIAAAGHYGINPRGLGMAVAVGASFAFLLPTGHPVNLLVMGPGEYQPKDYFKVGLPLLLVVVPIAVVMLQIFWL